jgi:hypothetical protein
MDDLKFAQVGELAKGIGENALPVVDDLSGRSLQLFFEDGSATRMTFDDGHELRWEVVEGPASGAGGEETYAATSPREGVYFVDYVSSTRRATSVSRVLDLDTGRATTVIGTLPTESEVEKSAYRLANEGADLTAVGVQFLRASLDRPFDPDETHHEPTDELVGRRVQYVYSQTETYEHIYLNEMLYTWQCLSGIEKGLADTDRCHCYRIADELYLFVWREKIVPALGVVLLDWRQMKTCGKLFGYETDDFGATANTPIGAYATLLNVTTHAL